MANYSEILRVFPAARHYVRERRWARRGDVLAYVGNLEAEAFSTDPYGFRHGEIEGERYGLDAALSGAEYGLVLGASESFGFGLESNAQTVASRLSQACGLYCINVSFPEADLRTLYTAALRILSEAPRKPHFIICFAGATFSRYAYTRRCDPLFGSPDFLGNDIARFLPGSADEERAFANLVTYSCFWLDQLLTLAASSGCPLVVHGQASAFDKSELDETEIGCALTEPGNDDEERFTTYRLRASSFRRTFLAAAADSAHVVVSDAASLSFIDEFHYTAQAAARIAADIALCLGMRRMARDA
ncbi:hypothetical protein [Pelagibacterium limicola]|uniref:hypothetical protein n=1 Tax=Pelagibacterium limicola TaxID=2791022 RepID=UPI0018AFFB9B|nr:hypothetical protein [Pelagibacterium limicola]